MGLRRRLEKLEKELKGLGKDENSICIFVREVAFNEKDEERMRKHEEELLEQLKKYEGFRCVIAVVDPKGWMIQIPDQNLEVTSSGEVHRYKES